MEFTYQNKDVDLVPAKRQGQYGNDHSLYKRKTDSWTKTNIDTHIHKIKNSGRITEIVALKIWRENHSLDFPSIYLECFAIEVLSGRNLYSSADNFRFLLENIRDNINNRRIIDPANSNNILSDELNYSEIKKLAVQATSRSPIWFNDYLPKRYKAAKATVVDSQGNISEQIDLALYDIQYSYLAFK